MGSKNKDNKSRKGKRPADGSSAIGGVSGGGSTTEKNVINDSRFAALHSDPRFREPPQKKSKVTIDSRFNRMFTDKNFASSKAPTDIRGKPRKSSAKNPLNHYYHIEEEEEESEKQRGQKEKSKVIESESDDDNEEQEQEEQEEEESESDSGASEEEIEKLKKVGAASSESEEDEDVESDNSLTNTEDSDSDDEMEEVSSEEEDTFVQKEDVPEIDKETKRLAVVNMDWGRVKAVDLYMLLSSFLPRGGQIISIAVYPSDFGLKRMEEEAVHGPVGLFDEEKGKDADSDDEEDDEMDNEKLRAYEMSRLRYYYAVVECDSSATADYLYKTCDGVEFERTSNKLDLRFIPDSMEFKHQPRDIATEAPADYEGLDFHTRALQHSNIELTWDEDEPQRIRTLKRQFNDEQLADLELKEFLASDESESDDIEEGDDTEKSAKRKKKQDTYRALLRSGEGSDGNNEDDDQDMEVTFNTGLEDLSKRILEKKDKQSETVWEAYLRKKKEKKKSRKSNTKDSSEDESSDSDQEPIEEPEDFFIEEPSGKGDKDSQHQSTRKGKQSLEASEEAEASKAELELLLADDKGGDANLKGYNMKPKKAKGKKGKEIPIEDKLPSIDYEDPRFSSLFKSPLFALDPTDPQFKRSAAYARQLAQKQLKVEEEIVKTKQQPGVAAAPMQPSRKLEAATSEKLQSDNLPSTKDKHELSSLVKSIKMKSQQFALSSQGKVVGKNEKGRARAKNMYEERGKEENEKTARAIKKKNEKQVK